MNENVASLRLFPGISSAALRAFLAPPIQGIILETYGAGNGPSTRVDLIDALKEATQRGVVIVNCSQCKKGLTSETYAASKPLVEAGVVFGRDMTPECALTKLSFLLGRGDSPEQCRRLMGRSIRGEITGPSEKIRTEPTSRDRTAIMLKALLGQTAVNAESLDQVNVDTEDNDRGLLLCDMSEVDQKLTENALFPMLVCNAVASNDLETLRALDAAFGSDQSYSTPDYDSRTPLHVAASSGYADVVRFLLERGASVHALDRFQHTPLYDAVIFKHSAVVELLRKAGAHFHKEEMADIIHRFHVAISAGELEHVKIFVEAGADPMACDTDGRTAMHKVVLLV